jgi:zinc-ribbon domain
MTDQPRCRSCGAELAKDQRYCLNCGARQGEPRLDFRQYEAPTVQPREVTQAPVVEEKPQRDYTPLAAVGGIAVLGIMLLIGVLIGKGDNGGSAAAPPPVIVGNGEAATEKSNTADEGREVGAKAKPAKSKGGKGGAAKGGSADTGNAPVASDQQLEELQEGTPEEKAEHSANLPDEVATGGKPPPEDNKAPGGGSKGTAIE